VFGSSLPGYGVPAEPLGVLVQKSGSIHALRVEWAGKTSVTFKVTAALKGHVLDVPIWRMMFPWWSRAEPGTDSGRRTLEERRFQAQFRPGAMVLCFVTRKGLVLHANGQWAVIARVGPLVGKDNEEGRPGDEYRATWDGPTDRLREAVIAILAGREVTVTARSVRPWGAPALAPWWRIKAGLKITRFVVSEESPHFVAWGAGWPDEIPRLLRSLNAIDEKDRLAALGELAQYRPPTKAALVGLRRALRDPSPEVVIKSAAALVRLAPDDGAGLKALLTALRHSDSASRSAAAEALADIGPLAKGALPRLLVALRDEEELVRYHAVRAIGAIGPSTPQPEKTGSALIALLKTEKHDIVLGRTIHALSRFGPLAWEVVPALSERLPFHDDGWDVHGSLPFRQNSQPVSLLGQLSPPPIETLATLLQRPRAAPGFQMAILNELARLGPRARGALPVVRRLLPQDTARKDEDAGVSLAAARAFLVLAPEEAGRLTSPLLRLSKSDRREQSAHAYFLLGRCGDAAKPLVPALIKAADENDAAHSALRRLLGPEHRKLLPALRRSYGNSHSFAMADVLLKLGHRKEAIQEATASLAEGGPFEWTRKARWLAKFGREAASAERALRDTWEKDEWGAQSRLALTLWQLHGSPGPRSRAVALRALEGPLSIVEGNDAEIGFVEPHAFWDSAPDVGLQEYQVVGEAIFTVLLHLEVSHDAEASLAHLLRGRSPHVRLVAAIALSRVSPGHPQLVPALRRLLRDHTHFFYFAADTLSTLGPKAAPIAAELLPLLDHPDGHIRRAAERVLRRLGRFPTVKGPKPSPPKFARLWADLAGKDAARADLAVRDVVRAGPKAVAFLAKRLTPPTGPSPKRIRQLLEELDSDNFEARQTANEELARHIEAVGPALRKALASAASLELVFRIDKLLAILEWPGPPEARRRRRCLRVLEEIGGSEVRALLKRLANGDTGDGQPWEEARSALRRLSGR
jgi:HEAT repeat protein